MSRSDLKYPIFAFALLGLNEVQAKPGPWTSYADIFYVESNESSYFLPILSAEKESVYIESRYNYEDFNTVSLFVGKQFTNKEYDFEFTPMLGGAAGDTAGVVPTFEFNIRKGSFNFYTEQEIVVNFKGKNSSYYFVWTDLTYDFTDWFYFGPSFQYLRPYQTNAEIDVGAMAGINWRNWGLLYYYYVVDEGRLNMIALRTVF